MLTTTMRKMMLLGIGALSLTREKAELMVRELTEKGEVNQAEAQTFVSELIRRGEQERAAVQKAIRQELRLVRNELGLVSRGELARVEARLKRIEEHLNLPAAPVEETGYESGTDDRLKRIEEHLNLPPMTT